MPNTKHGKGNRYVQDDAHNNNIANGNHHAVYQRRDENCGARFQQCCVPLGCSDDPIDPSDPYDAVKVICNNDMCTLGNWMHKDCFVEWEQSVLSFLRSCGRARSWSEKQRLQNLWTKKGYDLAYKACDCKCGRGHLRKDLDYIPPPLNDNQKKARKNKKKNDKPMPVVSTNHKSGLNSNGGVHNHAATQQHIDNHQVQHAQYPLVNNDNAHYKKKEGRPTANTKRRGSDNTINNNSGNLTTNGKSRSRTNSVSQNNDGDALDNRSSAAHTTSNQQKNGTANQTTAHQAVAPIAVAYGLPTGNAVPDQRMRTNSMSSTGSMCSQTSSSGSPPSSAGSTSPLSSSPSTFNAFFAPKLVSKQSSVEQDQDAPQQQPTTQQNKMNLFHKRHDLSAFSALPRHKQNPYNIHMEETAQVEEDTRNFLLSSLSTKRMNGLRCVLCKHQLPVFDQFPLIDGTLFLSPQAYDPGVVQVIWEGRIQFLNAVCMGCLEGASEVKCSSCHVPWDGRALVVGTMYTYDVFAATPCCQKRLTCKHCRRAVVDVTCGLPYYSQYSRMIMCPFCKANDYHFIRPLPETFEVQESAGSICSSD